MNKHAVKLVSLRNAFRKGNWKKFLKVENAFILIFLFGTLSFAIITPPGQNPDEIAHFQRTLQLGNFDLLSESQVVDGQKSFGGQMPTNVNKFFTENGIDYKFDPSHKFNQSRDLANSLRLNTETEFSDFRGASTYSPGAYLPMIPTVWIGKLLNLPIISLLYLMRIFSIIAVLLLLYAAIRITPIGKWMFFSVALLPSTLAQSAAVSADGVTIGVTILFISYVLHLALQKKHLKWPHFLTLLFLISTIGLAKIAYLPLVIFTMLIPLLNRQARNWRSVLLLTLTIVIAILLSLTWMSAASYIDSNYGGGVDIVQQKAFILHHPLSYLHILAINFLTEQNAGMTPAVWLGFFGNFGYLSAPLPTFAVFILSICLVCSVFIQSPREKKWLPRFRFLLGYRFVILATILTCIIAISTALYIYCSPVKSLMLFGLQGRYLIPIAPLLLLFFYGNSLKQQYTIKAGLFIVYTLITIVALLTVYHRYYI